MKIIIATGGTGGHIFTGLAIAEELDNLGGKVLIVASKSALPDAIIQKQYPLELTCQRPLLGKNLKQKLAFPVFLGLSLFQSIYIIMREAPDGVIGTGGFGSFSLVFVAAFLHIPTIITEIDSVPGLTTKILSRFAHEIWLAFPSAKSKLPTKKTMLAGVPVRKKITKPTKTIKDFGLCENKPTIFVFGGSRGARHINEVLEKILDLKILPDFQFIWQT
ncbi:UDP-N-acetylglucosamine--N-acetylmuramyl-(pentapeptide) pyrophosphoryl-undecaprenol N-acetylglucosamine transferase, partial [candidate division WOR-3 bacterium]|nr:UDP-N-acetylglucosamine--N-acetylmuramyl-(pentapeptide) pyrophosphoryl-undecaprenol N-acetylglucosamine transferase [candidate division WOR-3 bacterium]